MVPFISDQQASDLKFLKDPPGNDNDLSFVDSLLDFESIDSWFRDMEELKNEEAVGVCGGGPVVNGLKPEVGVVEKLSCCIEEKLEMNVESVEKKMEGESEEVLVHEDSEMKIESMERKMEGESGESSVRGVVSEKLETKIEGVEKEMESSESEESESERESSSEAESSTSGSSSSDEEEDMCVEKEKEGGELEEGEISGEEKDEEDEEEEEGTEVAWSDVDIIDEEEDAVKGPIRSKNELEVLHFIVELIYSCVVELS